MSDTDLHPVDSAPARAPVTSLRAWLDRLSGTDRLAIARSGIDLRFELAAVAKRLDGRRASFFPAPSGHSVPVVSGLVSNRDWIAEALGVPAHELLTRLEQAIASPLRTRLVEKAPVQEVVHCSVDLRHLLPVPTHNEDDSAPYITAGLLITRNPRTGVQNVAIHRCQISGPDRLGVLLLPRHTLMLQEAAEAAGQELEIAIVIGVGPPTLLASQATLPADCDELEVAGALHGEPIEVVQCITNRVCVPAASEIVIEGRILPRLRAPEGPFGEFPQYYGKRADRHVIAVDALTHRVRPIFHTIVGGGLEHLLLGGIPREAVLRATLRRQFPDVLDVHLSKGGVCRYHLYVQLRKRHEGQGKSVILAALSADYDIKHVIVVDSDVDIHDSAAVEWAVATRSQADRDLVVVSGIQASKLDPSTQGGVGAKMGIDATIPLDAIEMEFKRIRVPGEETIDLSHVLTSDRDWRRSAGVDS